MAIHDNSIKALKSFKPQSGKFINAPLGKKNFQVTLEKPIEEILTSMDTANRLTFIRKAIGEALVREGLLQLPEVESNDNSNRE